MCSITSIRGELRRDGKRTPTLCSLVPLNDADLSRMMITIISLKSEMMMGIACCLHSPSASGCSSPVFTCICTHRHTHRSYLSLWVDFSFSCFSIVSRLEMMTMKPSLEFVCSLSFCALDLPHTNKKHETISEVSQISTRFRVLSSTIINYLSYCVNIIVFPILWSIQKQND